MHPTVKPVALVPNAIKDCSRRGELVLDPFGGSGTTLVAFEIPKTNSVIPEANFHVAPANCWTFDVPSTPSHFGPVSRLLKLHDYALGSGGKQRHADHLPC